MSKDPIWEYLNTPANIAMQYFWFEERNKYDTERGHGEILYSNCCKYGRIKIPPFKEPPEFLKRLLDHKGDGYSRHFLQKIRQYNSMFAFT